MSWTSGWSSTTTTMGGGGSRCRAEGDGIEEGCQGGRDYREAGQGHLEGEGNATSDAPGDHEATGDAGK